MRVPAHPLDALVTGISAFVVGGFVLLTVAAAVGLLDPDEAALAEASSNAGGGYDAPATSVSDEAVDAPRNEDSHYSALPAWHHGEEVSYYDLGANTALEGDTVATAGVWAFVEGFDDEGSPTFIPGHRTLFDVAPGDEGYSDLWDVSFVIVPPGYDSQAIHSLAQLHASGLEIRHVGMLVNCPIVPEGSTIDDGRNLRHAWVRGEPVDYFHFGVTSDVPMRVWVPIEGFDADGEPILVAGQYPIVEAVPGESGYSDFQRVYYVTVDDAYEANSLRSEGDIAASGYGVTPTRVLLNRPVLHED